MLKSVLTSLAALAALSTAAIGADPSAPAEKKDSGSLSSGAKDSMPATKNKGENAPVGNDASSGASSGESGSDTAPGTKKPATSDPSGMEK